MKSNELINKNKVLQTQEQGTAQAPVQGALPVSGVGEKPCTQSQIHLFYPGLYVVGAEPSLGMTAFATEMWNHLESMVEHSNGNSI